MKRHTQNALIKMPSFPGGNDLGLWVGRLETLIFLDGTLTRQTYSELVVMPVYPTIVAMFGDTESAFSTRQCGNPHQYPGRAKIRRIWNSSLGVAGSQPRFNPNRKHFENSQTSSEKPSPDPKNPTRAEDQNRGTMDPNGGGSRYSAKIFWRTCQST